MSAFPTASPLFHATDPITGEPLALGKVYTYATGTTTLKTTWSDKDKIGSNTNPVVLNGNGDASIFLDGTYKFIVKRSDDTLVYELDGVSSSGGGSSGGLTGIEEIITSATRTIVFADIGNTFIANRGSGATFDFATAASLGDTFMIVVKNIGAGDLVLAPNAAETIDGLSSVSLKTGQSALVASNGTALRTLLLSPAVAAGTGIDVDATDPAHPIVKLDPAEDIRNYLDTAPYVATRTALKALDTTKDTVAVLTEAGREGVFVWRAGDYSALVTLDTAEGIYVKATAIASSAGSWVRVFDDEINVKWFGAKGDLSQDDQPAVLCCVNVAAGRQIYAPVGQYRMNATVSYTGIINLRGDGNGAGPGPAAQSNSNVTQFVAYFSSSDLFAPTSNYPSIFRDFQVNVAVANRPMSAGSAIHISGPVGSTNANSKIENVSVTNFYRGVTLTRPAYAGIRGNYFDSWVGAGIYAETSSGVEGSLGFIDGNFFFGTSGSTSQGGCVVSEIGYAVICNNLLLGGGYGVQFAVKNHDAGAFRVFDNFIENQGTTGVALQTQDTSKASMVAVCRNEFSNVSYTTSFDSSIKILDYSSGTDWLDDVLIADNVHRHSLDANARYIWLQSGRNVMVAREQFENLGAGSGTVGISTTFAGAALKSPVIVRDCRFLGTFQARYSVPANVQILEPPQIATAQAVVSLSNSSTAAQNIFAAANDALTVQPSTTYRFRAHLKFNTGATSHTTSFGFGGTATFTTCDYTSLATSSAANTLATPQMRRVAAATAAALTAASTAVTTDIVIEGILRTNGGGTIIPQVTFSAGPTGTCETAIDSYFEIEPVGTSTLAAIGDWA